MAKLIPQPHGGAINRIEKGDVTNPWGRPPKLLTGILRQLREAGYERVTADSVAEAYEILFGLDRDALQKIVVDTNQPMIMCIVARAMLSKKGVEMLEKMLDRAHGKPTQTNENKHTFEGSSLADLFGITEHESKTEDTPKKKPLAEAPRRDDRAAVAGGRGQSPIKKDVAETPGSSPVNVPKP